MMKNENFLIIYLNMSQQKTGIVNSIIQIQEHKPETSNTGFKPNPKPPSFPPPNTIQGPKQHRISDQQRRIDNYQSVEHHRYKSSIHSSLTEQSPHRSISNSQLKQKKRSHSKSITDLIGDYQTHGPEEVQEQVAQDRIIVQSRKDGLVLQRSMDTLHKQIDMLQNKNQNIPLDQINKYVGYKSTSLKVSLRETSGHLKKLVQEVKMVKSTMFPLRYYVYHRDTGVLSIWSKPNGILKASIESLNIIYVRISDIQDAGTSVKGGTSPSDYPFRFLLETTSRTFYLYAATMEERDIWVHEFSNFMQEEKYTPLNSVRSAVKDQIDPFESMEVINLSQHAMLIDRDIKALEDNSSGSETARSKSLSQPQIKTIESSKSKTLKNDKIVTQNSQFVVYLRGGTNYFLSQTLKAGDGKIEGILQKKSTSKMHKLTYQQQYLLREVLIDFRIKRICLRHPDEDGEKRKDTTKFIEFKDVEKVERTNLDIWANDTRALYEHKFLVFTVDRTYEFFSVTDTERELWIEHFCKIIDSNAGYEISFHKPSKSYKEMLEDGKGRSVTKHNQKSTISVIEKEGFIEYKSKTLMYSANTVKGYLIKRIENRKLFHTSNFHKRHFELHFDKKLIIIRKKENDDKIHKKYQLGQVSKCIVNNEDESIPKGRLKRSSSFLSKLRKDDSEVCAWNFSFVLEMNDRNFELYSPTRIDRDKWVYIFNLICKMNSCHISTATMSPFEFEKYQVLQVNINQMQERVTQNQTEITKKQTGINHMKQDIAEKREDIEKQLSDLSDHKSPQQKLHEYQQTTLKVMRTVETWLCENYVEMTKVKPGDINPSYNTQYLVLHYNRVQSQVSMCTNKKYNPHDSISNVKSMYDRDKYLVLTNLVIDLKRLTISFDEASAGACPTNSYPITQIYDVQQSNFTVTTQQLQEFGMNSDFKDNYFEIKIKPYEVKLVSAGDAAARHHWVRILLLIIQMNRLKIDISRVNPFVFERFQRKKIAELTRQGEAIQMTPKTEIRLKVQQEKEESFAAPLESESVKEVARPKDWEKKVIENFEEYYCSPTCMSSYQYIEGYMLKGIENQNMQQNQLRFIRIAFNSGKFVIKVDQFDKKMRSFNLADIVNAESSGSTIQNETKEITNHNSRQKQPLFTRDQIILKYNLNEQARSNVWHHSIKLQFIDRTFELACQSEEERDTWLRPLRIIARMNKDIARMNQAKVDVKSVNPYAYDKTKRSCSPLIARSYRPAIDQRKQACNQTGDRIDGQIISQMKDQDLFSNMEDFKNIQAQKSVSYLPSPQKRINFPLPTSPHQNFFHPTTDQQQSTNNFQPPSQPADNFRPTSQQPNYVSASNVEQEHNSKQREDSIVNQHITVQNITIQQVTMMQSSQVNQEQNKLTNVDSSTLLDTQMNSQEEQKVRRINIDKSLREIPSTFDTNRSGNGQVISQAFERKHSKPHLRKRKNNKFFTSEWNSASAQPVQTQGSPQFKAKQQADDDDNYWNQTSLEGGKDIQMTKGMPVNDQINQENDFDSWINSSLKKEEPKKQRPVIEVDDDWDDEFVSFGMKRVEQPMQHELNHNINSDCHNMKALPNFKSKNETKEKETKQIQLENELDGTKLRQINKIQSMHILPNLQMVNQEDLPPKLRELSNPRQRRYKSRKQSKHEKKIEHMLLCQMRDQSETPSARDDQSVLNDNKSVSSMDILEPYLNNDIQNEIRTKSRIRRKQKIAAAFLVSDWSESQYNNINQELRDENYLFD